MSKKRKLHVGWWHKCWGGVHSKIYKPVCDICGKKYKPKKVKDEEDM